MDRLRKIFEYGFLRTLFFLTIGLTALPPLYTILFVYPAYTDLLIENTEDEAEKTTQHIVSMLSAKGNKLESQIVDKEFSAMLHEMLNDFDIMKTKIYSADGVVLYSTDPKDIGVANNQPYFLNIVAKGGMYTEIVEKDSRSLEDEIVTIDVAETYVPIIDNGIFVGALEIYYDISGKREALNSLVTKSSATLLIIAPGLFFLVLFVLFQTAQSVARRKEAEKQLNESHVQIILQKEQLELLTAKLSKYLSPQVYKQIFSGEKQVKIESHRKKLTVFFADIVGFVELTDTTEPEALASLLNSYLTEMSNIALKYGGTIDKFIGDAIMIFFGDPETLGAKEDAAACVMMAMEMRNRIKYLNSQWESEGICKPLQIRFGINTGYCTVGNFGSANRLEYTIVGGNVNIANRIESRAEGNEILISSETYALVKDKIFCKKNGELEIKGVANPVQTYLVVDAYQNIKLPHLNIRDEKNGLELSINLQKGNEEWILETLRSVISKIEVTGHPPDPEEEI